MSEEQVSDSKKPTVSDEEAKQIAERCFDHIIEHIFTELVFQVEIETSIKQALNDEPSGVTEELNKYDLFDNFIKKENYECPCPNCKRSIGATRYAPHLEKCLGMGRVSSRIANRRLQANASSSKDTAGTSDSPDEVDSGSEWVIPKQSRRTVARKRQNRSTKASKAATTAASAGRSSGRATRTTAKYTKAERDVLQTDYQCKINGTNQGRGGQERIILTFSPGRKIYKKQK